MNYLLNQEKKYFNDPYNYYQAVSNGYLWRVRVFHYLGQIPHAPGRCSADEREFYPIELAVIYNEVRVASHLLSIDGYVLHTYDNTETLLHRSTGLYDGSYKGEERDPTIIYQLLNLGVNVNATGTRAFSSQATALMLAVKAKNLQAVQALLTAPNINIHLRDKFNKTALEIARDYECTEIEAVINDYRLQEIASIADHIRATYLPQVLANQITSYL